MNYETVQKVARTLSESNELKSYSGHTDPIEQELSYDLCEIVSSMQSVVLKLWPEIIAGDNPRIAGEALFELREELRHILYHIESSTYFSVICSESK